MYPPCFSPAPCPCSCPFPPFFFIGSGIHTYIPSNIDTSILQAVTDSAPSMPLLPEAGSPPSFVLVCNPLHSGQSPRLWSGLEVTSRSVPSHTVLSRPAAYVRLVGKRVEYGFVVLESTIACFFYPLYIPDPLKLHHTPHPTNACAFRE